MKSGDIETAFARTAGIDYPGADTPAASLKGRRVSLAEGDARWQAAALS
ncbi:MAG: hypothetical protein ACXW3N_13455 [Rhodoplanes sp.]